MSADIGSAPTVAELLHARHSVRAFTGRRVPGSEIDALLAESQRAPSWCNAQPWHVTVVAGLARDRLSARLLTAAAREDASWDIPAPESYEGDYLARRRAAGFGLYAALGIERDDLAGRRAQHLENFRFFGAPQVLVVSVERSLGSYALVDCGAFLMAFLLAAQSRGIATITQAALAMYSADVRDELGIPGTEAVVCGVSFGYRDPDHPANGFRTDRAAPQDVVRWVDA